MVSDKVQPLLIQCFFSSVKVKDWSYDTMSVTSCLDTPYSNRTYPDPPKEPLWPAAPSVVGGSQGPRPGDPPNHSLRQTGHALCSTLGPQCHYRLCQVRLSFQRNFSSIKTRCSYRRTEVKNNFIKGFGVVYNCQKLELRWLYFW